MAKLFIVLGLVAAAVGFFTLSEATMGVGIIGLACFLGILGRIAQAGDQHELTMQLLEAFVKERMRRDLEAAGIDPNKYLPKEE